MVGADDEAYDLVKPVFKQWASMVVRAGEPGAGTRMKLARNMLTFIGFAAACEAHEAGRGRRASTCRSWDGWCGTATPRAAGPARSWSATTPHRCSPTTSLYDMFVHTRGLAEKDLKLALGLGEATGVELPLAEIALRDLAAGLGVPHTTSTTKE